MKGLILTALLLTFTQSALATATGISCYSQDSDLTVDIGLSSKNKTVKILSSEHFLQFLGNRVFVQDVNSGTEVLGRNLTLFEAGEKKAQIILLDRKDNSYSYATAVLKISVQQDPLDTTGESSQQRFLLSCAATSFDI
jgi:hypothetical protein